MTPSDHPSLGEQWGAAHKDHVKGANERVQSALKCLRLIRPFVDFESVVVFGCGVGAWLEACRQLGARNLLGFEGEWISKTETVVPRDLIRVRDLSSGVIDLQKRYTLAMTIEVAEHLPEQAADGFCESLVRASDYILFSAAIPKQGGVGHINEQPLPYWVEKFWRLRYIPIEPIRPYIARDRTILPWLRQNIVMFVNYEEAIRSREVMRFARPVSDFRLHYDPHAVV
jgi:hypothetical protein